jgi:hypothetical protein
MEICVIIYAIYIFPKTLLAAFINVLEICWFYSDFNNKFKKFISMSHYTSNVAEVRHNTKHYHKFLWMKLQSDMEFKI